MALKIRLRQQGRTNGQVYRLVVTDSRSPRDGKYLEMVGWYNPFQAEAEKSFNLHSDRIQHWLGLGAQLTEKAETLVQRGAPEVMRIEREKDQKRQEKVRDKRRRRGSSAGSKGVAAAS